MKKRILIPYATYGSGHKSIAKYIKQYFELLDNNLFNEDELKSLKENYERLIDQYIVYYDELYKIEHNISSMGISLDINGLLESFVGKQELSKILKK